MRNPAAPTASAGPQDETAAGPGLLRFLTCGSVDDGKSTLIGRLLHDLDLIPTDQFASLEKEAKLRGAEVDLAYLLDGLEAEQEQGITIDVAYRYFRTSRRSFIVADSPGHEQYTRNMATGASVSDLAVLLVDARKGLLPQTMRHSLIVSLFGIRHVVLAVNKLDLVDYSEKIFRDIEWAYREFAKNLGFRSVVAIPLSAKAGDNVVQRGARMNWYDGPTLIEHLESVSLREERMATPFRLPVQWVCRPNPDFRGFAGTVRGGEVKRGDSVTVAGRSVEAKVTRILGPDGDLQKAESGQAIMLCFDKEIDASRGDVICRPDAGPAVADQFAANILWLGNSPMITGRSYLLKNGARKLPAEITSLRYRIDIETGAHIAAKSLNPNEIGFCNLGLAAPIGVDPFAENRDMGSFILIDRSTHETVGAGTIGFALHRAANIHPQKLSVDRKARSAIKNHKPAVLWFTGLSGAGKSTIANLLEQKLNLAGCHTYLIDGDNVRGGLNRDLGFTESDRVENVRRVQETARLFLDAGLLVLVSLISPYRQDRAQLREKLAPGEFIEIFVDAPLDVCKQRDTKGLYAKAARGELRNFTGVDAPYEPPENPELRLNTAANTPEQLVSEILRHLKQTGIVSR